MKRTMPTITPAISLPNVLLTQKPAKRAATKTASIAMFGAP